MAKKSKMSASQRRNLRIQQIMFGALGVLVIISMILSLWR
jgi:predicted nucleic acid-binding Zn ribbon protein